MREEKNELKRILGNTFKPWEEQKRECFRKKKKILGTEESGDLIRNE
jgi:hypothetical protein